MWTATELAHPIAMPAVFLEAWPCRRAGRDTRRPSAPKRLRFLSGVGGLRRSASPRPPDRCSGNHQANRRGPLDALGLRPNAFSGGRRGDRSRRGLEPGPDGGLGGADSLEIGLLDVAEAADLAGQRGELDGDGVV